MTNPDPFWLRVYRDVGADRYLSHAELPVEATRARAIWEVYDRLFGRFTGAGLDPLFTRFTHPASRLLASPLLPRGMPVVIVGLGPSLDAGYDELRHVRDRVIVASSLRGAEALQARGLHADLVLIEHQTVFDAQHCAEERRHAQSLRLHASSAVLAHASTPPSLLHGLDASACRLADTLPTWGLWPATMVALALEAGAPAIGLLGIDLTLAGTGVASGDGRAQLDPAHRPLLALLELLASASDVCRDCGSGIQKTGWPYASLTALVDIAGVTRARGRLSSSAITWAHERSAAAFIEEARYDLVTVRPLVGDARAGLELALQSRAGNPPADRDLTRAIELMLAWGADSHLRHVLQRGLGLSFLPRFWRTGIRINGTTQLWRPLMLALHELTTQIDRLTAVVEAARLEPTGADDASGMPVQMPLSEMTLSGTALSPSLLTPVEHNVTPSIALGGTVFPDRGRRDAESAVSRERRVSVLLPVKNGLPHLHEAIGSLIGQTHEDVEILVIDDGSDDGGPEEIQARALSHVRVLPSNGQGLAAALNTGLRVATGALVARQDADDWSHPERLARQLEFLQRHPEIDAIATCAEFVDLDGRPIETAWTMDVRRRHDAAQTPDALARLLPRVCGLHHGTLMARRDVLRQAGGYRPAFVCAQEYDLSLRLLPRARFAKLPARLYTYRVHERQTSQHLREQQVRAMIRARLEYVVRHVPRIATTNARILLAADPRTAPVYIEIARDVGLTLAGDVLLPAVPSPPSSAASLSSASQSAPDVMPMPDLANVDALVIADTDHGDPVDAWIRALDHADPDWNSIGICLVRRALTAK